MFCLYKAKRRNADSIGMQKINKTSFISPIAFFCKL